MTSFSYHQLLSFTKSIFLAIGSNEEHAALAAKALLSADLRGVDSHGIARLSGYVRLWQTQRVNATPQIKIVHETASTAVVDGDKGLGLVVGPAAMQVAIDKATQVGTGWVSVKNSNHFGIAGFHGMMALQHDMIGIAMTNASATVAPTFAKERLLGTNPICVVIPAGVEQPFVADFATTTAANGKLEVLQRKNNNAPHGWVQDKDGQPSTDVNELKKGGAMLPLGGDYEHGSHKGYMLGSVVDIFSAILSGANYGPWVPPFPAYLPMPENLPGEGIGHFFGAMRIDAFRPAAEFKLHMDRWIQRFKAAAVTEGFERVVIPGEPESAMEKQRMEHGIELLQPVINDLNELAVQFSLPVL
jgi:L-2-hydroxycarboxylate dehydrogenase (NAD+)